MAPLSGGRSARPLAGRAVGVYASGGAPWHHLALAAAYGADVRPVRAEDVAAGRLAELDVLIVPGGGATAMAGLLNPLGASGAEVIRAWVRGGGTYVSSCAGSVLPLALADEADAMLPTARCLRMVDVPMANPGDATLGGLASPGVGRIAVRLDRDHPFAAGLQERIELVHYNGPLFDLGRARGDVHAFAWPLGPTADFTPAEHFLPGADAGPTTLERCVAGGAATGIVARVDRGRAILFGSHPEFGLGPLLLGWGDGAALLAAALAAVPAWDGAPPRAATADAGWAVRSDRPEAPPSELVGDAVAALRRTADRFESLAKLDLGAWLDPGFAAAFHGRDARSAWRPDALAAARTARAASDDLATLRDVVDAGDRPWLDDAPRSDQDFGAMGLVQLLARVHAMLDGAERAAGEAPQRPAHAYDLFDRHPFHLAVGSYLSAAGLVSAALLLVTIVARRHSAPTPSADALVWLHAPDPAHEGDRRCS